MVKFEIPFLFGVQPHAGFEPDCSLIVFADDIPIKSFDRVHDSLLQPQSLNLITFYARKGAVLKLQPIIKTNTDEIDITAFPYFNQIRVLQIGLLYQPAKDLIDAQIAIYKTGQAITDATQNGNIAMTAEAVQALRDEYEASLLRLDTIEQKLANPIYDVIDNAVLTDADVGETIERTERGIAWNARVSAGNDPLTGATISPTSPYDQLLIADLTDGELNVANVSTRTFALVKNDNDGVSALFGRRATDLIPAQTEQSVIETHYTTDVLGNTITDQNPLSVNLGQDGQHLQSSFTLQPIGTPTGNLNPDGEARTMQVDFHAVVNGGNRRFVEIKLPWNVANPATGASVQGTADDENGEQVIVIATQKGSGIDIHIQENGANSAPISGGELLIYAHYENRRITREATDEIPAGFEDVRLMTMGVDGEGGEHAVVLIEHTGNLDSSDALINLYYGNNNLFETRQNGSYTEFYGNLNTPEIGNFYGVDARATYDLTDLQASAEAGDPLLGFYGLPIFHHTREIDFGVGAIFTDKKEVKRNILDELDVLNEAKNDGGGGDAPNGDRYSRLILTGDGVRPDNVLPENFGGAIANGNFLLPSGVIGDIFLVLGVNVIEPCTETDLVNFEASFTRDVGVFNFDISLKQKGYIKSPNTGTGLLTLEPNLTISGIDTEISPSCKIELAMRYTPTISDENLFSE